MKAKAILSSVLFSAICVSCGVTEKRLLDSETTLHFVSSDYHLRNEGYDWSVVSITRTATDSAFVQVRSRADRKKPSKTFSGVGAYNQTKDTITVTLNNTPIYFSLAPDSVLTISSPSEALLFYYGSGGATLAGTYSLLPETLDSVQLENQVYDLGL